MPNYVAQTRLYHTLDRSEVVEEGDPKAAFLLVGEGTELPESEVERLGLRAHFEKVDADPLRRTKARLADALERGALEEAQSHQAAVERYEMAQRAGVRQAAPMVQVAGDVATASVPTPKAASRAAASRAVDREAPSGAAKAADAEKK